MSKLLTVLFAALAVVLLGQEIKADKKGLVLAFVKNITDFKVGKYRNLAFMEPIDVKGPGNDDLIYWRKFEVNYSSLTADRDPVRYSFYKWVEITKVELSFEKHVGDVRAYHVITSPLPSYMCLAVEVPESNESDTLVAKIYGKSVVQNDE